jgi:Domain of unknown function (DUF4184)
VPYPFAHPAAVLPLARLMGRFAVPSALAIGSVAPDFWYFVPFVTREAAHSLAGLLWFCLPAALTAYVLFHLLLKRPLIALISPRLGSFTCAGVPELPLHAVVGSVLAGALTHIVWDDLTHAHGQRWLQHASTLAGSAILAWWLWRKLRRAAAPPPQAPRLSQRTRACVIAALLGVMALAALWSADGGLALERSALRHLLRTAGIGAVQGLGVALLVYCTLFRRKMP